MALIASVGTPTLNQTVPYVDNVKLPLIGAYTGGEFIYSKTHPSLFTTRPAYSQESYELTNKLIDYKKYSQIAVFYQDDAYGLSGMKGVMKAVKEKGLELVARGKNVRDSFDVAEAISIISEANPDCIILLSTVKPNLTFLAEWKKLGKACKFAVITGGAPDSLKANAPDLMEGALTSQSVPYFLSEDIPAAKEYVSLLKKNYPEAKPNYVGFETFISTKICIEALKKLGSNISRENLIEVLEGMSDIDVGWGKTISFSKKNHNGSDNVWIMEIIKGDYVEVK